MKMDRYKININISCPFCKAGYPKTWYHGLNVCNRCFRVLKQNKLTRIEEDNEEDYMLVEALKNYE